MHRNGKEGECDGDKDLRDGKLKLQTQVGEGGRQARHAARLGEGVGLAASHPETSPSLPGGMPSISQTLLFLQSSNSVVKDTILTRQEGNRSESEFQELDLWCNDSNFFLVFF